MWKSLLKHLQTEYYYTNTPVPQVPRLLASLSLGMNGLSETKWDTVFAGFEKLLLFFHRKGFSACHNPTTRWRPPFCFQHMLKKDKQPGFQQKARSLSISRDFPSMRGLRLLLPASLICQQSAGFHMKTLCFQRDGNTVNEASWGLTSGEGTDLHVQTVWDWCT